MELTAWLSLATICILGAMTPGPSLAMVLKHTVAGGRLNGIVTSVMHGLGVSLYAMVTVLGMAVIIKETPWLFNLIKYAGAGFLLWLAFKAFSAKSSLSKIENSDITVSLKQSAWQGFMIAFLNPKLALFFLALFSQFIDAHASWQQKSLMVATVGGIDTLWYCLIAAILSHSFLLDKLRNNIHWVEKATGVALIAITARVLI